MRKLWSEFKAIAMGGSVLDLALGFIIGAAFATLIQSFVKNLFLQFVAALIGQQDFQKLHFKLHGTPINYGIFLNDLLQFILTAVGLFLIVKIITWLGVERGRSFDQRQCPYCLDRVSVGALVCRSCGQQLVSELPDLASAERQQADREARRWPTLPPIPRSMPRRRAQAPEHPETPTDPPPRAGVQAEAGAEDHVAARPEHRTEQNEDREG